MSLLSCNNISKSFGVESILNNINFRIHPGDRIGVVGANGAGKSTLFKIISGLEQPDSGSIYTAADTTIGLLPQHPHFNPGVTVWEHLVKNFAFLLEMEIRISQLESRMARASGRDLEQLMKEYGDLTEEFAERGGYEYKSQIRGALKGLGIEEAQFKMPVELLSGGQKTRVALAELLLKKYHLLLLDEPTNYLDLNAVEWLENFLVGYEGAVMVISHDRYFLDRVCTGIFELDDTALYQFQGNYTDFLKQKQVMMELQLRDFKNRQSEMDRQREIIQKLKSYNREKTIKRAKSREKLLSRIEMPDKPRHETEGISIKLEPLVKSGRNVLSLENVCKSFPGSQLFYGVNLKVYRGERIGIIGPNGIGKTTLFNIISGLLQPDSGSIIKGHNTNIEYYHQQQENLNLSNSVLDEVWSQSPDLPVTQVRNVLAAFLFSGDDVYKTIDCLSGGERSRVALAKLMLSRSNLLLLDEPTNHLDIKSRHALEDALCNYTGTVLVISHDRYFLDRVTSKTAELTPEGINLFHGGYSYYRMKKQQQEEEASISETASPTKTAMKHQRKKEREEREKRKQEKLKLDRLEKEIDELEEEITRLEHLLCQPEAYSDPGKIKELNEKLKGLRDKLDSLYTEWEEVIEKSSF
ncbi:MAG: ABC-F family ATP-binding cassette domain-containing protein [Clostridiales bacterium]|nr:ABC-F family ATP-binding cassette domain-containing protein [Clostridiales bacterium]